MAAIEKMTFLSPPVLNIALDPTNDNDKYILRCVLDALQERITEVDSPFVIRSIARDIVKVCDVLVQDQGEEDKKNPDCGDSRDSA